MIKINAEMPINCWNCDFTFENYQGATVCALTRDILYPMGSKTGRDENCPLEEVDTSE